MTCRLKSMSPHLAELFGKADNLRRQGAALKAVQIAIADSGLGGKEIQSALDIVESCVSSLLPDDLHEASSRLQDRLSELDAQYFLAPENSDIALKLFRQARAAAALAFAI